MIKSYETYIWDIEFTTYEGLSLGPRRPKYHMRDNLFFKLNLFCYFGSNDRISKQVIKLNNTIIKELVKPYMNNIVVNNYKELFNYKDNTDPEFPDNYIVIDLTNKDV